MTEELIEEYSHSGQKIVKRIKHSEFGICIKKVQKNVDSISRMNKEISIQKELNNKYFPQIYDYTIDENNCVIYEEFIDGILLTDLIKDNSKYYHDEETCIELLKGLITALSYIWDKDIVHRDIKPDNIIIRKDEPVILDLGIAKNLNSDSVTAGIGMWGTPCYKSPEQVLNNRELFGKRSDMFSIGVVIYEAFYSKKPFKNDWEAVMNQVEFDYDISISEGLKSIIKRLLEKLPYDRYRNAAAILREIERMDRNGRN